MSFLRICPCCHFSIPCLAVPSSSFFAAPDGAVVTFGQTFHSPFSLCFYSLFTPKISPLPAFLSSSLLSPSLLLKCFGVTNIQTNVLFLLCSTSLHLILSLALHTFSFFLYCYLHFYSASCKSLIPLPFSPASFNSHHSSFSLNSALSPSFSDIPCFSLSADENVSLAR